MKAWRGVILCTGLSLATLATSWSLPAKAAGQPSSEERQEAEKYEKRIAKDKQLVAQKEADIRTVQSKLQDDTRKHGADSSEVRRDNHRVKDLRMDLATLKGDLYEDQAKLQIVTGKTEQAGEAPQMNSAK